MISKIIGGKRVGEIEIVIEPVVDCGSDREFHIRVEFLDRLRHQVGGRMSHPGEFEFSADRLFRRPYPSLMSSRAARCLPRSFPPSGAKASVPVNSKNPDLREGRLGNVVPPCFREPASVDRSRSIGADNGASR